MIDHQFNQEKAGIKGYKVEHSEVKKNEWTGNCECNRLYSEGLTENSSERLIRKELPNGLYFLQ